MDEVYIIECGITTCSENIASFDLDHTLIKPRNGRVFPKDYNDWEIMKGSKSTLNKYHDQGYKIVIFTNQAGKNFDLEKFTEKVNAVSSSLGVPFQVFCCTNYGNYRKPCTGMWDLLRKNNGNTIINKARSFFVGDMETDYKFALNVDIRFYDSVLMGEVKMPTPVHPFRRYSIAGCEEYVAKESAKPIILILVGPPASTKTTFCEEHKDFWAICQDDLKTLSSVTKKACELMKQKKNIIIDKQNKTVEERKLFIDMAKKYDYEAIIIWFDLPRELCEHLSVYREIMTGKHIPKMVYNMYYKGLEKPTDDETKVIKHLFVPSESKDLVHQFLV